MKYLKNNVFLMIFMFCFIFPTAVMAQGISVEITPSSGVPETAIKISGKGFASNEEIDILLTLEEGMKIGLGTEKVDIITSDATGAFTANTAIPRMAKPGQYKIEIIGNKGSQTVATLEVTAKK